MTDPAPAPDLSHIVPQLQPLAIPIDAIVLDPENARMHDERSLAGIEKSLQRYKQRKPIVVHEDTMTVKAGNGTVEAAKRLGWTHVAAVVVDEAPTEANGYALADNRTGELSEWNFEQLVDQIDTLQQEPGFDIESLGWSQEEIDNMMKADWSPPTAGDSGGLPSGDDVSRKHTITMSDSEHEILQRVLSSMRAKNALHPEDSDGLGVATLAEYWQNRNP